MKKTLLILLILGFILWGAYWFFLGRISAPEFLSINIDSTEMISLDKAIVLGRVKFFNPNLTDATLLNTEIKAYSNGVYISQISQTNKVDIQSKQNFEVPIRFEVNPMQLGLSQSLSGLFENVLNKKKTIPVKFDGYCRIKTLSTIQKIPFVYEDNIEFE
jgi:LEA14-like dessication related protein